MDDVVIREYDKDGYHIIERYLGNKLLTKEEIYISSVDGIEKEKSHEQITRDIYDSNTQIQDDNLLNMEISTDTNARTMTIGDDSLLLMEMLLTIDEKLNQLLQPK